MSGDCSTYGRSFAAVSSPALWCPVLDVYFHLEPLHVPQARGGAVFLQIVDLAPEHIVPGAREYRLRKA